MADSTVRVLWTTNIVLPAVAENLAVDRTPFGGWLSMTTQRLSREPGFTVGIAMRADGSELTRIEKDNITYFALPCRRLDRFDVRQEDVELVLNEFSPDLLHVEGAEMRHAHRFLASWKGPHLLSMQGVLNGYAPYELGCLPVVSMLNPRYPRIMMTAITLMANRTLRFSARLVQERNAMQTASHIMGRTLWDRAQAMSLNPSARYYSCPRILRDVFYKTRWQHSNHEPHSIFVGNAASPRKGAHVALQALAQLKRTYPDVVIYFAGEDPTRLPGTSIKRFVGYPAYIQHLIKTLNIEDSVKFTGILNAREMAQRASNSHIFLMPSLIENSPNTLAEAMLIGMPIVVAYAGGAPSMAADEQEALFYRANDPAMLALQISRILNDQALAERLGAAASKRARHTHDPRRILDSLKWTYKIVMRDRENNSS